MANIKILPNMNENGPIRSVEFWIPEHSPSWQVRGEGTASVDFQTHIANPYLTIHARETAHNRRGGRDSTKTVMVTLDADASRVLYEWLKSIHEGGG